MRKADLNFKLVAVRSVTPSPSVATPFNLAATVRKLADLGGWWPTEAYEGERYSTDVVVMVGFGKIGSSFARRLLETGAVREIQVVLSGREGDEARFTQAVGRLKELGSRVRAIRSYDEMDPRVRIAFDASSENFDTKVNALTEIWRKNRNVNFVSFTSGEYMDRIGQIAAQRLEDEDLRKRVAVFHPYNPPHLQPDIEVWLASEQRADGTMRPSSPKLARTLRYLAEKMDRRIHPVGMAPNFVGNFGYFAMTPEIFRLIEEGVSPERIDRIMEERLVGMGPCKVHDLVGADVYVPIVEKNYRAVGRSQTWMSVPERARSWESGRGKFYSYKDKKYTVTDEVSALRQAETDTTITDEEIFYRLYIPLLNALVNRLEARVFRHVPLADALFRGSFRFRRGPFEYADHVGLATLMDVAGSLQVRFGSDGRFAIHSRVSVLSGLGENFESLYGLDFVWDAFRARLREDYGPGSDFYVLRSQALERLSRLPRPIEVRDIEHIAIAVRHDNFEATKQRMMERYGLAYQGDEVVEAEGVTVAKFELPNGRFLELVTPNPGVTSAISRFLEEPGGEEGIHHLSFLVDDLNRALDDCRRRGIHVVGGMIRSMTRGTRTVFVGPSVETGGVLIELVERPRVVANLDDKPR